MTFGAATGVEVLRPGVIAVPLKAGDADDATNEAPLPKGVGTLLAWTKKHLM